MKTAEEIYRSMLAVYEEKTGFAMHDASDLAVRLYAAAAELESLYAYSDWALTQSFPQTASGEYLDYHGTLRGLSRRPGTCAGGVIRFVLDMARQEDIIIEAGTVCTTAGLVRFVTTEPGTIEAGQTQVEVSAEAEQAGTAGNVAAGTVIYLNLAPAGVAGCVNPSAFTGGTEPEDDEAFRARILDSFQRLPNGANAAYYENRVLEHEGVSACTVIPRYAGVGTVGVVVAGPAGPADEELIAAIQADLEAVREIAVEVTVLAPTTVSVPVTAQIWPKTGVTLAAAEAAVKTAIEQFFTGERLSKPVYRAALGNCIYDTGVVENFVLQTPAEDVAITQTQLPVCGAVTVTKGA